MPFVIFLCTYVSSIKLCCTTYWWGENIGNLHGNCPLIRPKFSLPNIVHVFMLMYNRSLNRFAKVFPPKYTESVILPKFHLARILHYNYGIRYLSNVSYVQFIHGTKILHGIKFYGFMVVGKTVKLKSIMCCKDTKLLR